MSERAAYDSPDYVGPDRTEPVSAGILRTEFSPRFADLMRAAMLVSNYKYGKVADAYPEKVNAVDSIALRLQKYADTGNVEFLVDVANFAMIEFMHPAHERAHFQSTDADQSPGRIERCSGEAVHWQNRDIFA